MSLKSEIIYIIKTRKNFPDLFTEQLYRNLIKQEPGHRKRNKLPELFLKYIIGGILKCHFKNILFRKKNRCNFSYSTMCAFDFRERNNGQISKQKQLKKLQIPN